MKIIKYTLTINGTIPDYIIDGGYLSIPNNLSQPQDFDLIGLATDDAPENAFLNKLELIQYINDKNLIFMNTATQEHISSEDMASFIWDKLG